MPTPPPRQTASELLEQGQLTARAMLRYWMSRGRVTGQQIHQISSWGLGEQSVLDKSTISRVITGRRAVSVQILLALDAWNRVVHAWQTKGQAATWEEFGPHTGYGIRPEWLDDSAWLPLPEDPSTPLELADFLDVLVGRLPLPYIGRPELLLGDCRALSENLSQLLNEALTATGQSPREAIRLLLEGYPVTDDGRRRRLRRVVLGDAELSQDELQSELFAIAEAIRSIRGLPVGSYGPQELAAELSPA